MSSTRLPGKVLLSLLGKPMLARQVERLLRAEAIDKLIIATSSDEADDPIAALAEQMGLGLHRGSADDVLDRFYRSAEPYRPSHVVRLTADCPLADWTLIDRAVDIARSGLVDYASTALRPTWPDGLDAEVMTFAALEIAWREARTPVEREHVTPFIVNNPQRFRHASVQSPVDLSKMRWTVDEPRDFDFVTRVYEALYLDRPAFTTGDVLELLRERPALLEINQGIERNEGLRRSIEKYVKEQSGE